MNNLPAGILLAAGQSSRFGSNKLLYPIQHDTPMLIVSALRLTEVLQQVIVVINKNLLPYTEQLQSLGLQVVINEQAEHGMGTSIACGIHASQDSSTGWLIALADMPNIQSTTIRQLAQKMCDGAHVVAPIYRNQRGHPVGFNAPFKNELLDLRGEYGARHLIDTHQNLHKNWVELIPSDDPGVLFDIDTVTDLER